jgi:hypothetical protein
MKRKRTVAEAGSRPRSPSSVVVNEHTEWTDFHGIQCLFGLRRSTAYHLDHEGLIHSVALKEPGEKRGKRLFHVGSVRQYIESKTVNPENGDRAT